MPVLVSVTVNVTSTLVPPEANTQWRPFTAQPSRILTSSSMLPGEKNQKLPLSVVKGIGWAMPSWPGPVFQLAMSARRV